MSSLNWVLSLPLLDTSQSTWPSHVRLQLQQRLLPSLHSPGLQLYIHSLPSWDPHSFLLTFILFALGQFYSFKCHPNPNENTKCQTPPATLSGISNNAVNKVLSRIVSLPQICLPLPGNTTKTSAISHGFFTLSQIKNKSYWLRSFPHKSMFAAPYCIAKGLQPDQFVSSLWKLSLGWPIHNSPSPIIISFNKERNCICHLKLVCFPWVLKDSSRCLWDCLKTTCLMWDFFPHSSKSLYSVVSGVKAVSLHSDGWGLKQKTS